MAENKRIIDLYTEEFENLLDARLDEKLKQVLSHLKESETLISRQECMKRLGIVPSTLAEYTNKGILTSYRIGYRVYYKWSEVVAAAVKVEPKY